MTWWPPPATYWRPRDQRRSPCAGSRTNWVSAPRRSTSSVPHKATLEVAIIIDGFEEAAAAFEAAVDGADDPLGAFVGAYRSFASAHPHVYRLMTQRPLPRDQLPEGLEARAAAPLVEAVGSPERARAAWAFIHGMTVLELDGRFPTDDVTEPAWRQGVAAFRPCTDAEV